MERKIRIEIEAENIEINENVFHFHGFPFQKNRGNEYFRCSKWKECPVKVKFENGKYYYTTNPNHNHECDILHSVHQKLIDRIGNNEHKFTENKQIAAEVLISYEDQNIPGIQSQQNYISRKLNAIGKLNGVTEEQLEYYILYQSQDNQIVIIGDRDLIKDFKKSDIIFCDGTFKTSPEGFDQLYMLHGIVDGRNVPFFYCLLGSRKNELYERMFKEIDKLTDNGITCHNFTMMGDMEIDHFNFLGNNIKRKCCQFHFNKAICTNARELKCSRELVEDLMVLAIAPLQRVYSLFRTIIFKYLDSECKFKDGNLSLLTYFFNNYIIGNECTKETWNVSTEEHRTNNICESFNKTLNKYFKSSEPLEYYEKPPLEQFYSVTFQFIETRKKFYRLKEKKRVDKYSSCKTTLIQQLNEIHSRYNNEWLLLSLKLIRRITDDHAKREKPLPLDTITLKEGSDELVMEILRNINEKIDSYRINDPNLRKEMEEIKIGYNLSEEEMINYLNKEIGMNQTEENQRRMEESRKIEEVMNNVMYNCCDEEKICFEGDENDDDEHKEIIQFNDEKPKEVIAIDEETISNNDEVINVDEEIIPKEKKKPETNVHENKTIPTITNKKEVTNNEEKKPMLSEHRRQTTKKDVKRSTLNDQQKTKRTMNRDESRPITKGTDNDKYEEAKDYMLTEIHHLRIKEGEIKFRLPHFPI